MKVIYRVTVFDSVILAIEDKFFVEKTSILHNVLFQLAKNENKNKI
jgi:hypothetical protein